MERNLRIMIMNRQNNERKMDKLYITTPDNFSFKSTLFSHGWSDLQPFQLNEKPLKVTYVVKTSTEKIFLLSISEVEGKRLEITTDGKLNKQEKNYTLGVVKRMFRLEEDYDEFYKLAGKSQEFSWVVKCRAGRLLRCSSLWEDMVKMLCTTNCTWRLTQIMTENLVTKLGSKKKIEATGKIIQSFPEPQDIANQTEIYLRKEIKMGYRAPYLLEFGTAIMSEKLNLVEFENNALLSTELYKKIRNIKGFGDYAVSNLLKLLGRYDKI